MKGEERGKRKKDGLTNTREMEDKNRENRETEGRRKKGERTNMREREDKPYKEGRKKRRR